MDFGGGFLKEEARLFGKTGSLVGVISDPSEPKHGKINPAVILLNAGFVHRVGPNRLYVKLARALAANGFVALRFDFSGIGDSPVRYDNLPFDKSAVDEVQDAMDLLTETRQINRFLLLGICSGAEYALSAARRDPRVIGAAPINPVGDSQQLVTYVKSRRYWKTVLFDPKRWLNALMGKVNFRLIGINLKALFIRKKSVSPTASDVAADLQTLTQRGVDLLHIFSNDDPGLAYFDIVLNNSRGKPNDSGKLKVERIPQTDHIFSTLRSQELLLNIVQDWAQGIVQDRRVESAAPWNDHARDASPTRKQSHAFWPSSGRSP